MTKRRIKMMILASWLWAAFCATGPLIGWSKIEHKEGASQCGPVIPKGALAISHSLLITISNFVIPLAVMTFCYVRIFREIHVHMQRIRKTSNIDMENSVAQQRKVATTLFLVLACFVLCWVPFIIYSNMAAMIKDKNKVPKILNPLAYWCGYLNSACNPIIYAFRSPSFRKGYKEIMCGSPAPGLSAVNSLSFRSRSARGSLKSNCNTAIKIQDTKAPVNRQRTLLSQTSWRSLPMIPSFVRSISHKQEESVQEPESPTHSTGCTMCGLCPSTPDSTAYDAAKTDDETQPSHHNVLNEVINEEEDVM